MIRGYVISKNNKNKEINIIEYEKNNGFDVKPKNKVKKSDSINVSKVIFMSPSMIEKIVNKKVDKQYNKIISLVEEVATDDSDDTSFMVGVLNEVELFKSILIRKYAKHMLREQNEKLILRLNLMSKEIRRRIFEIEEEKISTRSMGGKNR